MKKSDAAPSARASTWAETIRANALVPVALVAVLLLGWAVEGADFDRYYRRIVMLIGFNVILAVSLQLINGVSGQFSLGHAGFMAVGAYMAAYPAIELSQSLTAPGPCLWFYVSLGIVTAVVGLVLFGVFRALRAARRLHPWLPMGLLLALGAWLLIDVAQAAGYGESPPWYFLWTHGFTLSARSLSSLLAAGVPLATDLSTWMPEWLATATCFVVLVVGGGACAGAVGFIVGLPALRLRGDYLAIATLGLAEIIRILIQNSQPLGGALGLTGIPKETNFVWLYGFAVATIVVIWRIAYSDRGKTIMAVREDEVAASAVGIDTTRQKVTAFMIGAFFGGVAGALFALHERSIAPYQFGLQKSIEIVVMVTLGGLGSVSGAILAAVVLTLLPEVLRPIAEYRMIIYSLLLIGMMLLRPQGLMGGRELWPRRRRWAAQT